MKFSDYFWLLILLVAINVNAQHVQWGAEVVAFSSQYSNSDWSAKQVLGPPNAFGNPDAYRLAWSPKKEESAVNEYIRVRFAEPMRIQQLVIAESSGPGAIHKIYAFDKNGDKHLLYQNESPRPIEEHHRLFRHKFSRTDYFVLDIRVELKTTAVKGPNHIDAIAISDSKAPITLGAMDFDEISIKGAGREIAENLGPNVNSQYAERLPIISSDGQTLYFARKYHPQNIGEDNMDDIWVSKRMPDGSWSRAVNIGAPLNNRTHNFVVATNSTGNVLYLANDYNSKAKDGVSVSYRKRRTWSRPKTLNIQDHYNDNIFVNYHVNLNGDILLMSVERKDSKGDRDLYVSFKAADDEWTRPLNLGNNINTTGSESSVFLAADNKTIYFSSDGHDGYGGLDMFMSKRLDGSWTKWSAPRNIGVEINSSGHDYNYTIPASGEYAYFSRDDERGMSDLYRIKLPEEMQPEPVILLSGNIIDAETDTPVQAAVKYKPLGPGSDDVTMKSLEDGSFQMVLPYGKDIGIYAELEGYFAVAENLELGEDWLEEEDYDVLDNNNFATSSNQIQKLEQQLENLGEELDKLNAPLGGTSVKGKSATEQKEEDELRRMKEKFNKSNSINTKTVKGREPGSKSDNELNALKNKFKAYHRKETFVKKSGEQRKDEEDKLAALKKRFNRHHDRADEPQNNQDAMKLEPSERDEDFAFEQLKKDVRINLESEIAPQLQLELQDEMMEDIRPEVEETLGEEIKDRLATVQKQDIEEQVKKEFEMEARKEIRKEQQNKKVAEAPSYELMEIKEGLKISLEGEVREELTATMRAEMKREMEYRLKKEIEAQLQNELEAEIQKQREDQGTDTAAQFKERPAAPEKEEPSYKELKKDVLMVPLKVGQVIPMHNIFFNANESSLKEASFSELERVYYFLENNPNLVVEVGGHTNGWCSHEFASELSRERANAVADFFRSKGIGEGHIQFKGYGKTQPISDNNTLSGRKKNQRVELKILEILE